LVAVITALVKNKVNMLGFRKDKLGGEKYYELSER
jgi:hypothetical protein